MTVATTKNCENARKIPHDQLSLPNKIRQAFAERDVDDAKEGVREYIKATDGEATYHDV